MATVDVLLRSEKGQALSYTEMDNNFSLLQSATVPIGSIVGLARNFNTAAPAIAGWLECDGSGISQSTYVNLYNEIGQAWNYLDQPTTTLFYLPDLRGGFIRGRSDNPAYPDIVTRDPVTGFNKEDTGSLQFSATADHDHFIANTETAGDGSPALSSTNHLAYQNLANGNNAYITKGNSTDPTVGLTSLGTWRATQLGAISPEETRPINLYVTYMIKY
jgi:microcystin-dependent protein